MGVSKQQAFNASPAGKQQKARKDWSDATASTGGGLCCWGDADPERVLEVINRATRQGMGVSFSATANGTGVSVTILDGPDRPKWYMNTPEDINSKLEWLADFLA